MPYSCEVVVEEYKDEEKIVRIRANVMVSRTSQKSIVIGHQGKKIKKLWVSLPIIDRLTANMVKYSKILEFTVNLILKKCGQSEDPPSI